ncbi:YaiO family outer membrane beta-barrel protein [Mangrovibacterium marinum]|uniref:YaiO family outer membrane protein n=1 Tax=Mangrovibacterium marinum TaxID=1639118 RepID=A0A2T5BXY1_9BACT|nr:YaiO family outer membrane beta-barrel protein [Mangrovibacterium marinum]PTN05957.1 YaiO family outer membrane protein [Mangrovibacterium marinum]
MEFKSITPARYFLVACMLLVLFTANAQVEKSSDELLTEALALTKDGQYEKAIAKCEEALFITPDYPDIHQLLGKLFLIQQNYNGAKVHLAIAHTMMPDNRNVRNDLISLNILTGNYAKAEQLINEALQAQPDDQNLLLKKIDVLKNQQKTNEALAILREQHEKHPKDEKYLYSLTELRFQLAGEAIQNKLPEQATKLLNEILADNPSNRNAYIQLFNLAYANHQLDEAIQYSSAALQQAPDDSLFLIKNASFLAEAGQYEKALAPAYHLMTSYPSAKDSALYADILIRQASAYRKQQNWEATRSTLEKAAPIASTNLNLMKDLATANFELKHYQQTIDYANRGLKISPAHSYLLIKKAAAYEELSQYEKAYQAAYAAAQTTTDNRHYLTYADYLKSKTYKNQIGIIHLHSIYSDDRDPSWISSLQYMRRFKKASWIARANYRDRGTATGYQLESELYYQHNQRYYSYALAGWSSDELVFPKVRAGYSLFRSFNKGWEGELGSRYVYSLGYHTVSALASVGKYWGNNWTNIRVYAIHDDNRWDQAYSLNHRFYLNDKLDYIAIIGALGTSPDDRSRQFGTERVSGFLMKSAGLGYQKNINYRWTINLVASYANQRIPDNKSYNQYDFYLTLLRNF